MLGCGPDGGTLTATYKGAATAAFQDGVGQALLRVAATVPDGVLVFLPSYGMLDKLVARWTVRRAVELGNPTGPSPPVHQSLPFACPPSPGVQVILPAQQGSADLRGGR